MCVYIYICIYIYIDTEIDANIDLNTHINIFACMHVLIDVSRVTVYVYEYVGIWALETCVGTGSRATTAAAVGMAAARSQTWRLVCRPPRRDLGLEGHLDDATYL